LFIYVPCSTPFFDFILTLMLSFRSAFFNHRDIWELNYFCRFAERNKHSIRIHEFQGRDSL
jgi:hypothetical protein